MSLTRRERGAEERRDGLLEVVDVGHERVDHDDELRARLDGDVEVRRRDDAAVDELAVLDVDGLVDHRQRGRRADRLWRSARRPSPRRRSTMRSHVSRSVAARYSSGSSSAEVVGAVGVREHRAHVLLDPRAGVEARRQRLGEAEHDVHHARPRPSGPRACGRRWRSLSGSARRCGELGGVRAQQRCRGRCRGTASGPAG